MRVAKLLAATFSLLLLGSEGLSQDVITLSDGSQCGLLGDATSKAGKALDKLKNRFRAPTDTQIDHSVTMAALLAPGDDLDRFDASKGASIKGFVIDVKVGGKETCNCHATRAIDRDTHIELALAEDAPETQRVIIEVTPRLRQQMKAKGVDWSTDALKSQLTGKWIEATGWLLFDTQHVNEAENTNPGDPKNWRATCWEIHPVTSIEVLTLPRAALPSISKEALSAFHKAQVQAIKLDPKKQEFFRQRNENLLKQFDKDELEDELHKPD
jgi:hypothetical protein